ncbi:MAG TPA: multiheme c-type cytochrome [Gemmataceae bacterium]|nr:multiheme c-type cytochrome [Gemmataceae bacterium]
MTRFRWLAAGGAITGLFAAVVLLPGSNGYAQTPKAAPKAPEAFTAFHCIACHGSPQSDFFKESERQGRTKFVRLDEYQTWNEHDLHSQAYRNIVPDEKAHNLAWQMQQVLSPVRGPGYEVHKAAECLTCHAVDLTAAQKPAVPLKDKAIDHFHTQYGVSCEGCHGLTTAEWLGAHSLPSWRDKGLAEKEKFHQVDLRDPYTRAVKCASCHVGNKAEGKFVTHEMYAAGHPPLPPFELVTFARDAPRHYHTPRENAALAAMDPAVALKVFHYRNPKDECPEARDFSVGTVAAFEAAMKLLADDAKETRAGELLDFAHFDCFACHHDLKHPSYRQARAYRGVPGRPTMRPWATETLRAVLQHAEAAEGADTEKVTTAAKAIRDGLIALNKAFGAKPFGVPETVAREADGLATQCRAVRPELDRLVYTPAATEALFHRLVERLAKTDAKLGPDGLYLDHDTAQQTAWGLAVLREGLRLSERPGFAADPKAEAELDKVTALRVRGPKREPIAGDRLKDRLERVNRFEPGVFLPKAADWLKATEKK